jgi:hypothetical protein
MVVLGSNIALVIPLGIFVAAAVVPALIGGTAMTSLPPGHIVIYQPVSVDTLTPGDVIAYQPATDITITHRVIRVDAVGGHTRQLIVQGDAHPAAFAGSVLCAGAARATGAFAGGDGLSGRRTHSW